MFSFINYFNQLKILLNQVGIELSTNNSSPSFTSHKFAVLELLGYSLENTQITTSYKLSVFLYDINFEYEPHIKLLEYITVAIMYIWGTKDIQVELINYALDENIVNSIVFTFSNTEFLDNSKLLIPNQYLDELKQQINI